MSVSTEQVITGRLSKSRYAVVLQSLQCPCSVWRSQVKSEIIEVELSRVPRLCRAKPARNISRNYQHISSRMNYWDIIKLRKYTTQICPSGADTILNVAWSVCCTLLVIHSWRKKDEVIARGGSTIQKESVFFCLALLVGKRIDENHMKTQRYTST